MTGKPIIIIAGVGNAAGTGAASAKEFAKALGYRVAVVARRTKDLQVIVDDIAANGGEACAFPLESYSWQNINKVFEEVKAKWPDSRIKVALWNASQWSRIPFLDVTEEDINKSVQINVVAAFAWSQSAIKAMLEPLRPGEIESPGGTLLFTGATSATRGAANFATFAAGKHGLRALSQSLAREFGKRDIHVAHVIIDGTILTQKIREMFGGKAQTAQTSGADYDSNVDWLDDESRRLNPESIAKAFVWLHLQDRSAWTLELDLRPSKEHF